MQKQQDSYEEVIKRSNSLRERKEEISQEDTQDDSQDSDISTLNNRQFITGLISGKVVDVGYNNSRYNNSVELDVKTSKGEVIKVSVDDSGQYSERNELVRLLEWKDIPEARVDDLIEEDIVLRSEDNYQRKSNEVSSIDWKVYVPQKLDVVSRGQFRIDNILRRLGMQSYEDYMSGDDPVSVKLLFLALAGCTMGVSLVITSMFLLWMQSVVLFLTVLLLINIYLPAIANYVYEGLDRYKEYKSMDAVKRDLRR